MMQTQVVVDKNEFAHPLLFWFAFLAMMCVNILNLRLVLDLAVPMLHIPPFLPSSLPPFLPSSLPPSSTLRYLRSTSLPPSLFI